MVGQLKEAVGQALAPLKAWESIAEPEVYIESRLGRYISGLEMLLEVALKHADLDAARALTLDLIKMTRLGKTKVDLTATSVNKLRDEIDFRKVEIDELRRLTGRSEE